MSDLFLITPLVSFGHCVVWPSSIYRSSPLGSFGHCVVWPWLQNLITSLVSIVLSDLFSIYRFWLHLWYLLAIVLSVPDPDYPFGIFWPLCCMFFFELQILITSLVSFGHCVVSFLQILITPLVSFGHCVVWPIVLSDLTFFDLQILQFTDCVVWSSIHFWYRIWSFDIFWHCVDLLRFTDSEYTFGIFWPFCCLLRFTDSDYTFGIFWPLRCLTLIYRFWLLLGIFWPLCCLSFFDLQILVSFGHCVYVLLRITDSDYLFGIFWPLCCLTFFDLQILITPLVSFGHCVVWIMITSLLSFGHCVVWPSSIYRFFGIFWYLLAIVPFWLPLCYLLAIVLSDLLRFTYGIFLTFFDLHILITPLVSFGHCVVWPSSIYRFWLPLWYLLAIVLSHRLRITDSDYTFGIFWPLCCLTFLDLQILRFTDSNYFGIFWPLCCLSFFDLQILITPLVSFDHCVVCPSSNYRFWLPLWYLLAIVLSDLLRFTDSDYTFGIFWPLCCLFFFVILILITTLVSFGHCVVWPSSIYRLWLPLCYLLAIVLSDLLRFTDSDYIVGIFWPLCCLTVFDLHILVTSLVSFGHCVVCSLRYWFWLPLWYLLAIVLSDLFRFTDSDYLFVIFWPLCCLTFFDLEILITPLVSFGHCVVWPSSIYILWLPLWYLLAIVFSDLLRFTDSDNSFGVFWSLCCLLFFDLQILITPLVSFGHCVVWPCSIYRFWLPLWYLLAIVLSHRLRITDSDYLFGIFWPFWCLTFFDLQILITSLVSFGHCVVWPFSIYRFWLHLWYLLAIVLSDRLRFTESDYTFGVFWSLCCVTVFDLQILITYLVSFGHCVVWPSSIYRFWLHRWYLLAIVLSDRLRFTDSDYTFGIFWPLCCLTFFDLQILITPLVSFGHCVVWPSSIYRSWLHLWYLLAIVLSVLLRITDSDYLFGIFWPLCCLTFFDLQILITPLVSFGHCVVCSSLRYWFWLPPLVSFGHCVVWPSSIYRLWLPLCYLLAIVLSDLLRFTDSDYTVGIFWPLCCLTVSDLQILVTSLLSFGHCVVCSSLIYWFWLPLWYLLAIVLSDLFRFTDSDYLFGIFWPLCCLTFFDLQILITHLVSFGHCVVCSSLIYWFWLPLWYLLAIVFYVLLRFTDPDYSFGIFWPLYCLSFFDLQSLITSLVSFDHCVVWTSSIYRFWIHL